MQTGAMPFAIVFQQSPTKKRISSEIFSLVGHCHQCEGEIFSQAADYICNGSDRSDLVRFPNPLCEVSWRIWIGQIGQMGETADSYVVWRQETKDRRGTMKRRSRIQKIW